MMGLRESILEVNIIRKRPCVVCETIKILDKADAAELVDCLDDESISSSAIGRALHARGYKVHQDGKQVRRHRKECNA